MSESAPFDVELPFGDYAVRATIVDDVVIAASIAITKGSPTRWELALTRGVRKLVRDRSIVSYPPLFGFGVDVGLGAFMDARVADRLDDDDDARDRLVNRISRAPRALAMIRAGKTDSIAVFRTGLGDGLYGVYLGYRRNRVVHVVADFGAVMESCGEVRGAPTRIVEMDADDPLLLLEIDEDANVVRNAYCVERPWLQKPRFWPVNDEQGARSPDEGS
jgi:hypothetical protein